MSAPLFANHLLSALGADTRALLEARLAPTELAAGDVIIEQGRPKARTYFIESGLVAILRLQPDGARSEAAMVGREGLVGSATGLEGHVSAVAAEVQAPGFAWSLPSGQLAQLARERRDLSDVLHRYAQFLIDEGRIAATCNAAHAFPARLARWLLSATDRLGEPVVQVTHQALSEHLSIQRTTATETLKRLAGAGLVRTARARIEVLDANELETISCRCYADIKARFDELGLSPPAGRSDAA